MSVLARIFLVLYGLLFIAFCGGLIALSWNDDEQLDLNIGDYNLQAFVDTSSDARLAVTIILGAVALIAAISVVVAVLPWGRRGGSDGIRVQRREGGTVEVSAVAVERLLADELRMFPGVRQVAPDVRERGGAIEVDLEVSIDPGANIAEVTSTVSEAAGAVLREQVGATNVRRPTLRITYEELAIRQPPPVRPTEPPEGPLPPPPPPPTRSERLDWSNEGATERAAVDSGVIGEQASDGPGAEDTPREGRDD